MAKKIKIVVADEDKRLLEELAGYFGGDYSSYLRSSLGVMAAVMYVREGKIPGYVIDNPVTQDVARFAEAIVADAHREAAEILEKAKKKANGTGVQGGSRVDMRIAARVEELLRSAEQESTEIVTSARRQADEIINEARREAQKMQGA